jgi:hypothetical protein
MNEKTRAAVMAGVAIGGATILMALVGSVVRGAGCCNCLLPIAGGVLAVYFYSQKSSAAVDPKDGAMLGAIAGAVGGLLYLVIGIPLAYFISAAAMEAQFAQLRDQGMNLPAALTGFALFFVFGLIGAIIFTILATIGGLIGAAIFGKKGPGGGAVPPPPPVNYGGGAQPPASGGYGGGGGGTYGAGS